MKHILLIAFALLSSFSQAQPVIELDLVVAEETSEEKIYNVIADNFDDVLTVQYTLSFDTSRMQFKEVRQPVLDGLSNANFNDYGGYLFSVWFDPDLLLHDLPNPVTIYQLVFETLEPGGSTLCFSTDPLETEISLSGEVLAILVINDDCHTGLVLDPYTTATHEAVKPKSFIHNIHLSRLGELSFDNDQDGLLSIRIFDVPGREIGTVQQQHYTAGRNSVNTGYGMQEGLYYLEFTGEHRVVMGVVVN